MAVSVIELESHCLKSLEKVTKVSSITIAKHLTGCGKMRLARKAINSLQKITYMMFLSKRTIMDRKLN